MSSNLSHIHFLTISIGFSVLGILPSFNQSVSWAVFSCRNWNREESSLKLIQVFGRICLPVVVWLRALVSYWLLTRGHPQVLETTIRSAMWPFPSKHFMHGYLLLICWNDGLSYEETLNNTALTLVKMWRILKDGNTRPPDLPLEKPVCRSGSNSLNWTWKNRLFPNRERSMSKLYIVTLLI